MILVYRLLINLVLIFSPLIILIRLIKKKEHQVIDISFNMVGALDLDIFYLVYTG